MNNTGDQYNAVAGSVRTLLDKLADALPNFLLAVAILVIGWLIGSALGTLVKKGLEAIGIDSVANRIGLQRLAERTGRQFSLSSIVQWIIKWFFFLASIIAAADILNLDQVTNFFYQQVIPYAGHVVIATVILLLGVLAANFFGDIVEGALRAGGFAVSSVLSSITRWAIIAFSVIAALYELQIATTFLQDLFRALIAMVAIAGGLAFGLGGRDHARKILDAAESQITNRNKQA
jgi:hypothetical protein